MIWFYIQILQIYRSLPLWVDVSAPSFIWIETVETSHTTSCHIFSNQKTIIFQPTIYQVNFALSGLDWSSDFLRTSIDLLLMSFDYSESSKQRSSKRSCLQKSFIGWNLAIKKPYQPSGMFLKLYSVQYLSIPSSFLPIQRAGLTVSFELLQLVGVIPRQQQDGPTCGDVEFWPSTNATVKATWCWMKLYDVAWYTGSWPQKIVVSTEFLARIIPPKIDQFKGGWSSRVLGYLSSCKVCKLDVSGCDFSKGSVNAPAGRTCVFSVVTSNSVINHCKQEFEIWSPPPSQFSRHRSSQTPPKSLAAADFFFQQTISGGSHSSTTGPPGTHCSIALLVQIKFWRMLKKNIWCLPLMYFNTAPYDLKCFGGTGTWYGLSAKNEHVRNEDSDTPTYPLKIAFKSQITHIGTSGLCFFVGLKKSSREEHDLSLSLSITHPCNSATYRSNGSTAISLS